MALIEALLPKAEHVRLPAGATIGPLSLTFLVAMATPIIVLPIERIWKPRTTNEDHYNDERYLDDRLASTVDKTLGAEALGSLPFIQKSAWRFIKVPYDREARLSLAENFSDLLGPALQDIGAAQRAEKMPPSQWAACLRNSLGHGGVVYLDSDGEQAWGREATMLAFVSGTYDTGSRPAALTHLNALRITSVDLLDFLRCWVEWLNVSGIGEKLAA